MCPERSKCLAHVGIGVDGDHRGGHHPVDSRIRLQAPGEASTPFRSQVGYHLFRLDSRDSLTGDALVQARGQIREILYRQKYDARLKDWLVEIKQRAIIDIRM